METLPALAMPDLAALVDPLLGLPYAEVNCWELLRKLYSEAWQIDFDSDPMVAVQQVQEIWWQSSTDDPFTLVQPWDVLIFRALGFASQHVGVVVNQEQFCHTRQRNGVCLEYLRRWRPRLLQMARLRRLL